MEKVVFDYKLTPEIFRKGMELSEMYNIGKTRKIVTTGLCLFIIINSGSALLVKFDLMQLLFILFAVACGLFTLFGEKFQKNAVIKKHFKEVENVITLEKGKIHISQDGGDYTIDYREYKGYKENAEMFLIYFADRFVILPKVEKTEEEINVARDLIETFYSTASETKDEDWGFEDFVPSAEETNISTTEEGENNE